MILCFAVGECCRFIDVRGDAIGVAQKILEELAAEARPGFPGQVAVLTFVQRAWEEVAAQTDNHLLASINVETGYGALIWYVTEDRKPKRDINNQVWVTNSLHPVEVDPRVVADPDCGTFYHPRSTIPLDQIRAALEEFCTMGTGDRPECVTWVSGGIDGRRDDEPYAGRAPDSTDAWQDPWSGNL
ncbi:Imm1 family immunity protein [Actinoplanes xinjiangensis]|uniref:Imm1 family immunity protein n=1 Tax=Actinoplanes xinjiangensis TaxID=512350 RepID=UPI003445E492